MKKQKILVAVLALSIVCGATAPCSFTLPNEPLTAFAEEETPTKVIEGVLTYYVYSDYAKVSDCDPEASGEITIPSTINGVPVTMIGESAFSNCIEIESLVMPDSIESIGGGAFEVCPQLRSVRLSNSITSIPGAAFYGCLSLESIVLPDSVTRIEDGYIHGFYGAFGACESLTSIIIPDSVEYIGRGAFRNCTSLEFIDIPDSVTSIMDNTFRECSSLTSVNISDSVEYIDYSAFEECISLESINIPDSVTSIGSYAFNNCNKLKSVVIPDSVVSIETNVFSGTIWLEDQRKENNLVIINDNLLLDAKNAVGDIVIPDTVKTICGGAFMDNSEITSVIIPESVTNIELAAFLGCYKLKSVNLPKTLTKIDYSVFKDCSALRSIDIPDSIISIEPFAFENCSSLESITIPDSVKTIGSYGVLCEVAGGGAFVGCSSLKTIVIPASVDVIETHEFTECNSLESLVFLNPNCFFRYIKEFEDDGSIGCYYDRYEGIFPYIYEEFKDVKIYGLPDSLTKELAEEVGLQFYTLNSLSVPYTDECEIHVEDSSVQTLDSSESTHDGDVNSDGETGLADALAILQYIANPSKYPLSEEALKQADVYNTGDGITPMDALVIQKLDAGLYDSLPVYP